MRRCANTATLATLAAALSAAPVLADGETNAVPQHIDETIPLESAGGFALSTAEFIVDPDDPLVATNLTRIFGQEVWNLRPGNDGDNLPKRRYTFLVYKHPGGGYYGCGIEFLKNGEAVFYLSELPLEESAEE